MSNALSIVIIGTGLAGYLFAKELRKRDSQSVLTLLTHSDGHFYSKPLLSTALTQHKTPDQLAITDKEAMGLQLNAEIITRCAVYKIDTQHKKIAYRDQHNQDHLLSYDKIVLANGAQYKSIAFKGDAVDEILSVNQLEDYRLFREKLIGKKQVAILGSGLIGCEFTNDLLNVGFAVSMISPDQALLQSWVPKKIGDALQSALATLGAQFYLNTVPEKINSGYDIVLSDGKTIHSNLVFAATGIQPDLSLAKSAGLLVNRGVIVDDHLQTSDPHIYALGDCAEINGALSMYVAPIMQNARILAMILTGENQSVPKAIMPVVIKTPVCPIVCVPPSRDIQGEWQFEGTGVNVQGLFYDNQQHLSGFALSGDTVKEKTRLLKKMSDD